MAQVIPVFWVSEITHLWNYNQKNSYGHLLVVTGYKWDYTFYKWGFVSTYNW